MSTALIVEDNIEQMNSLRKKLSLSFPSMNYLCAYSYEEAISIIESNQIDFFLLDVELVPGSMKNNGINIGEHIRSMPEHKHTPILFLTARADQISAAVNKTHCYNYLLKPYSYEVLINSVSELLDSPFIECESPLKLKDTNGIYFRIMPSDIIFIQAESKVLIIQTESEKTKTRRYTLAEVLTSLPEYFCQCHKSFVINVKKIKTYDRSLGYINVKKNNELIPVGRKYKENLESILKND